MDFDDHDDADEEEEEEEEEAEAAGVMPVASSAFEATPTAKLAAGEQPPAGSGARKPGGGGRYRECLKNHAVGIGGHAVDGCGDFIAAGEEGTLDALRCAACGCHRNFHRREGSDLTAAVAAAAAGYQHHFSPYYRTPAAYVHPLPQHARPAAAALALPSTSGGGDDVAMGLTGSGSGKKRYRTKFSQEQKDKMLAFAEKVGWRIQKHDEAAVQQFCEEVGVQRHVLKVWMHNNKHTLGKKP